MANTASNVLVGQPLVTGGFSLGLKPLAKDAYPTDATAPLAGLTASGYIGEDGVTETIGRDTEQVKAWGGDVVRRVQTDHSVQYKLTLLEVKNPVVLKAVYGEENVTIAEADGKKKITINKNAKVLPHICADMQMLDGATRIRNTIPDAQIVEMGDVVFVHSDVIKYEVTLEAYADVDGNKAIQIMEG